MEHFVQVPYSPVERGEVVAAVEEGTNWFLEKIQSSVDPEIYHKKILNPKDFDSLVE